MNVKEFIKDNKDLIIKGIGMSSILDLGDLFSVMPCM